MLPALARLVLRPFRAFIALLFTVSSLSYLVGVQQPQSVDAALPDPIRLLWGGSLLLGGVALLAGLASGIRPVEKAGLLAVAGGAMAYALSILAFAGIRGLLPAGLSIAVAVSCLVDSWDRLQGWARRTLLDVYRQSV